MKDNDMSVKKAHPAARPVCGLLFAALCMAGCGETQTPQRLLADAQAYHQKGDDKAAIIQLQNALQKDGANGEARLLLGTLLGRAGNAAGADSELRKALALGMPAERVMPELGRAMLMQGQYQPLLDISAPLGERSAELLALRGHALLALGQRAPARAAYSRALELRKDLSGALIGLAKCALLDRDIEAATRWSEQALRAHPADVEAWLFKGDLLRAQGRGVEALAAYAGALKLQPNSSQAYLVKANLEISLRQFLPAQADIAAAKKLAADAVGVWYAQALLDFNQGKQNAAQESIQRVLRVAPEHMPSLLLAGMIDYSLGSTEQAVQYFKKYADRYPGNVYASKMLAAALLKNGQAARAQAVLAPALDKDVADAQLWLLAGEIAMKENHAAQAHDYFAKADRLAPHSAAVHTALGLSQLAQGSKQDAVAELDQAVSLGAAATQGGAVLATTLMGLKENDKALTVLKAMQAEAPTHPLAYDLEGQVYLNQGQPAKARASFARALAQQNDYFSALNHLAQLDLAEHHPDAAARRFDGVLRADPKNVQAMLALATIAQASGQGAQARAWLEKSVAAHPDSLPAARAWAGYQIQTGDKAKGLALLSNLQRTHPGDEAPLEMLAQAQLQSGDVAAALASYRMLARMKPESGQLQLRIASLEMALNNPAGAQAALKTSLQLDPANPDARYAQAQLAAAQGDDKSALALARQMEGPQPGAARAYVLEGDILSNRKQPDQAVAAFDHALALGGDGAVLRKIHHTLARAGKGKEAQLRLQAWVDAHPGDIETRMYQAQVELAAGHVQMAQTQWEAVLRDGPNNAPAMNNLALVYQQEKDPRALAMAEKARALLPDNPAVLDTLAAILLDRGDSARALPLLEKASAIAPRATEIRYHLAQALDQTGDKARAHQELAALIGSGEQSIHVDAAKVLINKL